MNKLVLLGIACMVMVSCGKTTEDTSETAENVAKVRVGLVTNQEVNQNSEFTATVEPEVRNNIAPGVPGRIRTIFVEVGDRVSRGQRLVQMDDVNLANLEMQINNLKDTYSRISNLFEVGGASRQDLDNIKLQLDIAETNYKNLKENTYLLSPINGIVTARYSENGDLFSGQAPVLTVMQINPVKLKINVSESFFTQVKKGMDVDVMFDVYKDEIFTGKVSLVHPTIDQYTRTFPVEITMNNADSKIRPGMFARVSLSFGTVDRAIVPDRAIVKQPGSGLRFVYVYKNGVVNYKQVELGRRIGTSYEVISGLNVNDQVVIAGHAKLNDGAKAEVLEAP